jgi:hypothetical protein
LVDAQSHRTGPLVPPSALAVWNVSPAQSDFALQSGRVALAISSPNAWPETNGLLAEFTFQVQPGAADQYLWPVILSGVEITGDGFNNRRLPVRTLRFTGRAPLVSTLGTRTEFGEESLRFFLTGEKNVRYLIEVSTDLVNWTPAFTLVNSTGLLEFADPQGAQLRTRFYRARLLD